MRNIKAVALLSGGLDSTLAVKLVLDQGIQVEGVNFLTSFCTCTPKNSSCLASQKVARELGINLKVFNLSVEYLSVVKKPKYGYGSGMNPCLDCRIFMFKKAAQYMKEKGASFLVTGEVVGQRPMSQRRETLQIIEEEANLKGLILRPLSAKILPPTIPELRGWVDREKLLALCGRSRKEQFKLINQTQIQGYFCPSGGCLLTDPIFAKKIKDLLKFQPDFELNDVQLLKVGRHFRLSPYFKVVMGRKEEENKRLERLARKGDFLFQVKDHPGPLTLGRGKPTQEEINLAASLTVRYSKAREENKVKVLCRCLPDLKKEIIIDVSTLYPSLEKLQIY